MSRTRNRNPYIQIMRAAERGEGVLLTADEVITMSLDTGIASSAYEGLTDEEKAAVDASHKAWACIKSWREA